MSSIYLNPYLFGLKIKVPASIIIGFNGAVADIPDTWLFCNGTGGTPDLRNKYIRGADGVTIMLNATGGATTGQVTGNTSSEGTHGDYGGGAGNGGGGGNRRGLGGAHSHPVAGDMDWKPPSREVIFIKSTEECPLPAEAILWVFDEDVPAGCSELNAMRDRFALGVSADSRTQVGSDSRGMSVSILSGGGHNFAHSGSLVGYDAPGGGGDDTLTATPQGAHTHSGTLSETHTIGKPPYLALLCVKADAETGAFDTLVVAYDGDLGDLPDEWELVDEAVGRMVIGANGALDVGDTGGSSSNASITGSSSIASASPVHRHVFPTEEGVSVYTDHDDHTWTHSHASWTGAATVMPPWHALYLIKYTL